MANSNHNGKTVEIILSEAEELAQSDVSAETYYMASALRRIQSLELDLTRETIAHVANHLRTDSIDNPASGHLLAMLLRNTPTRQSVYESLLEARHPGWNSHLSDNPQRPLPDAFAELGSEMAEWTVDYVDEVVEAAGAMLDSKNHQNRLAALRACERLGASHLAGACLDLFKAGPPDTRTRALLAASRLSDLDRSVKDQVIERFFDRSEDELVRLSALEALLSIRPSSDLQRLIGLTSQVYGLVRESPMFIEALLDVALDSLASPIEKALSSHKLETLPGTLLRRVARCGFLPNALRQSSLRAFRDGMSFVSQSGSGRFGTVVHRNSSWKSAFVGHVGVSVTGSGGYIIDCTTGRDPKAVSRISFGRWKSGRKFYGFRIDCPRRANLSKVVLRAKEIMSWRTEYDGAHNNQKGKWFKGWFCRPRYWEADCVGFAETCYERSGGNPTPRRKEAGRGWPLTPREQRDHMCKV